MLGVWGDSCIIAGRRYIKIILNVKIFTYNSVCFGFVSFGSYRQTFFKWFYITLKFLKNFEKFSVPPLEIWGECGILIRILTGELAQLGERLAGSQ